MARISDETRDRILVASAANPAVPAIAIGVALAALSPFLRRLVWRGEGLSRPPAIGSITIPQAPQLDVPEVLREIRLLGRSESEPEARGRVPEVATLSPPPTAPPEERADAATVRRQLDETHTEVADRIERAAVRDLADDPVAARSLYDRVLGPIQRIEAEDIPFSPGPSGLVRVLAETLRTDSPERIGRILSEAGRRGGEWTADAVVELAEEVDQAFEGFVLATHSFGGSFLERLVGLAPGSISRHPVAQRLWGTPPPELTDRAARRRRLLASGALRRDPTAGGVGGGQFS